MSEHDPWQDAETRYQAGQEIHGAVTRVTQLGVFVQTEPGLEGIIYTFELGPRPSAVAGFAPGQEIQLYVKSIDANRRRLELSLAQQTVPGLLEERDLPAAIRRNKQPDNLAWPAPPVLPDAPLSPPNALHEQGKRSCPTCQRAVQDTWKHCVYCGGSLHRHCPACGSIQPDLPDAHYCCECGKSLG